MKCMSIRIGDNRVIACGGRKLRSCGECRDPAGLLCDWKLPDGKTCDKPLCHRCTSKPSPGKDLCKEHAKQWATDPRNTQRVKE